MAAIRPEAVAVVCGKSSMTYGELEIASSRMAHRLRREGVVSDTLVGIFLPRSLEMILGLLAILKAGGGYLPLEPDSPEERNRFVLNDAGPVAILTRRNLRPMLPETGLPVVCVDDPSPGDESQPLTNPESNPENLCYALLTSGSTGRPKAVAVEHRAVMRLIKNPDFARMDSDETWLVLSPLSFDLSTLEIWAPLCNGGRAAVVPEGPLSMEEVGRTIREQGVTSAWLTSGLFRTVVEERIDDLVPLRQLIVGGDVVPVAQSRKVIERFPGLHFVNGYGPTENTTFSCCHRITAEDCLRPSIPIGRAIANSSVHILDPAQETCPVGVEGEIHVGGDGLARGYLNRPDLTAEKFLLHRSLGRLYATGDRGRWLPEGVVEFLGRTDEQIKIRGFRIEPGEIESALMEHPGIRGAVVVPIPDAGGEKKLAACVVPQGHTGRELRAFLARSLPPHMIPTIFVGMERLPVTPNGKVDRRLLCSMALAEERPAGRVTVPLDRDEKAVWEIWCDVLGRSDFSPDESFFDLGGDSLQLARIHSRLQALSGEPIPITELFGLPTARAQAARIAGRNTPARSTQAAIAARAARQRGASKEHQ